MPAQDVEQFSALIADIYDATLDAATWPQVLQKTCAFVGGCASNVFSQDTLCDVAQVHYSWGDDPHYRQLYLDKFITMNPLFPAIAFGEVGRVGTQSDIISFEEFHETRFYKEWARPQGYVDCLFSLLEKSATGCAMISVRRDERDGLVDAETCRRMGLIVPHVRRAVLISRALEHRQASSEKLNEVLDLMSAGIFLIGADGRVMHENQAGAALLDRGDVLIRRAGQLIVCEPGANTALSALLASAQRGDLEMAADQVVLPFSSSAGEHYVAHILPLTSGLRRSIGEAHAAAAAVFVKKVGISWASPAETVAKVYKLTPSEIRVLLAIAEHDGAPQAAAALGISEETMKTHLRHVFQKTGRRRQIDLVKLLAEFAVAK